MTVIYRVNAVRVGVGMQKHWGNIGFQKGDDGHRGVHS